jgi:large subunit ribosomal protein L25
MKVPLHFKGDDVCPAVKTGGGVVNHITNELDVECLPANLPEFIEVDLSKMEVGQTIHAKDITLPAGVNLILHVEHENPAIAVARMPLVSNTADLSGAPEAPSAPTAIKVKDKE